MLAREGAPKPKAPAVPSQLQIRRALLVTDSAPHGRVQHAADLLGIEAGDEVSARQLLPLANRL
eukprot:8083190-Alexandrium_andersonii.AAC.1